MRKIALTNQLLLWLTFIAAANVILFGWNFVTEAPRSDAFRHIQNYLIPYLDGDLGVTALWSNHHPRPLHALIYILNAEYFGLDYRIELLAGLIGLTGLAFVISREFFHSTRSNPIARAAVPARIWLGYAGILAVLFSLNSQVFYTWSLVTFSTVNTLLGVVCYTLFTPVVKGGQSTRYLFFLAVACLLLINFDRGLILAAPLLLMSLFLAAMGVNRASHLRTLLALLVLVVMLKLLIGTVAPQPRNFGEGLGNFASLLQNPAGVLEFYGVGLTSGLVGIGAFNKALSGHLVIRSLLLAMVLLVYLSSIFVYLHKKMWETTFLPLALILLPLLFMTALLVFRHKFNGNQPFLSGSPRYALNYYLGWAGVIWIYTLAAAGSRQRIPAVLVSAGISSIILLQLYAGVMAWKFSRFITNSNTQFALSVLHASEGDARKLVQFQCRNSESFCTDVVSLLQREGLNLFSDAYAPKISRACDLKVKGWKRRGKNSIVFTFSEDVSEIPVDISVNGQRVLSVRSFRYSKIINRKNLMVAGRNNVVFSCYVEDRFEPFAEIDVELEK